MALTKKVIGLNSVDGARLLLDNDQAVRSKNSSGVATPVLKLDASDKLQLLVMPEVSADASSANQLVRKSQFDAGIAAAGADVAALEAEFDAFVATKAQPGGLASLDMNGKLPSAQVPAIAITDVFVVANIAARDALGGIEEGDVAKVTDAGAGLPKTYIHDGTQWIEIESGSDVDSVNGQVGTVVLAGSDIGLSSPVMLQSDVQSALSALEAEDLTFLKLDGTRAMTAPLAMGTFDITDAANIDALSLNVNGAAATSIVSGTSITLDAPIVEVATSLTTEKVEGGFYSLESGIGLSLTDANSVVSVASGAAVLSGAALAFTSGAVSGLTALTGAETDDVASPKGYTDAQAAAAQAAAESYTDAQLDTLHVPALHQETYTLDAGQISSRQVGTANEISGIPWVMLDNVLLKPGVDYTVAAGNMAIEFPVDLPSLIGEELVVGDTVYIWYTSDTTPFV